MNISPRIGRCRNTRGGQGVAVHTSEGVLQQMQYPRGRGMRAVPRLRQLSLASRLPVLRSLWNRVNGVRRYT